MVSRKAAHFAPGVAVDDGTRNGGGTGGGGIGGGIGGMFASPKKKSVSIVGSTNSVDGVGAPVVRRRDKSKLVNGGQKNPSAAAVAEPQKKKGNFKSIVHSRSIWLSMTASTSV